MCDFSPYGGASTQWLAVQATLPAQAQLTPQSARQQKAISNQAREAASANLMESLADKVQTRDHTISTRDGQTIMARSYTPLNCCVTLAGRGTWVKKLPVYMHLHGGGYIFGTLSSEDATCARIASSVGVVVLNVNYRHTPEHTYPTAWNDVEDSFAWLHSCIDDLGGDAQRVVLGGISAGAQLAASVTLGKSLGNVALECPPIAGQVLMIPCLVHGDCYAPQLARMRDVSISSYTENREAPILPERNIRAFLDLLGVEHPDPKDLRLNPGNASIEQVRGLPPTTIGIAGLDPLRDEGLLYAKLLSEAGVPTDIYLFKGVPHGFRRFGDRLSASEHWDRVLNNAIIWALRQPLANNCSFCIKEL